jgi:hypothetical protein
MTGLSERTIRVSAAARGIAEADSVGIAANEQAATPINNRRFLGFSGSRVIATCRCECFSVA